VGRSNSDRPIASPDTTSHDGAGLGDGPVGDATDGGPGVLAAAGDGSIGFAAVAGGTVVLTVVTATVGKAVGGSGIDASVRVPQPRPTNPEHANRVSISEVGKRSPPSTDRRTPPCYSRTSIFACKSRPANLAWQKPSVLHDLASQPLTESTLPRANRGVIAASGGACRRRGYSNALSAARTARLSGDTADRPEQPHQQLQSCMLATPSCQSVTAALHASSRTACAPWGSPYQLVE